MSFFRANKNSIRVSKKGLGELETRTFELKIRGHIYQGFVICKNQKFYAYQNLCKHLPVTLDLKDNEFFTHDKAALQCHMHGAIYDIETGHCTKGPCVGADLNRLEVIEEKDQLIVTFPDQLLQK